MFDAAPPALPVPTKTNGKNNKKYDGSFSFGAALLSPPKSGGVAYLHRIIHLLRHQRWHQLCLRKQGNKGYEGGHLVQSSCWFFLWRVDSNGARGYCLYWSGHSCKRVLLWGCTLLIGNYLTNKGFEANAPASAPNFSFRGGLLIICCQPRPPRVVAPSLFLAFSFGTEMYQPRGRGGRASQKSDQHCPLPHWKWWGTASPLDNIWRKYEGSGKNFRWKQQYKRVVTLVGNEETKKKNGKDYCQWYWYNKIIVIG